MLPYVLGFFRADLWRYFTTHGFKPKNLKLYHGKNIANSLDNLVGTYGNVILVTEVESAPLTTLNVPTDRGTFPLKLVLREFMATPSSNNNYNAKDSDVAPNNRLFKSVLCRFFGKKNGCNNGNEFAHGKSEIKTSADLGPARQPPITNAAALVEKQVAAESLSASGNLVTERGVNLDEFNTDSVPLGGPVTDVATKAALTASVDLLGKANILRLMLQRLRHLLLCLFITLKKIPVTLLYLSHLVKFLL